MTTADILLALMAVPIGASGCILFLRFRQILDDYRFRKQIREIDLAYRRARVDEIRFRNSIHRVERSNGDDVIVSPIPYPIGNVSGVECLTQPDTGIEAGEGERQLRSVRDENGRLERTPATRLSQSKVDRILDMHREGATISAICKEIYGSRGGRQAAEIKWIIGKGEYPG